MSENTKQRYVRWRCQYNDHTWWIRARGYREAVKYGLRRFGIINCVQRFNWI